MQLAPPDHERDVAYFSREARQYEDSRIQGWCSAPIHKRVLDLAGSVPDSSTILDVGCGTGRLLRTAGERWPTSRLVGVDPAAGMIAVAREKTPKATFYETPANAIPLPDASVAIAFATVSFHHWADKPRGLMEISRVLRPGGAFINADLLWPNWIRWLVNDMHTSAPAPAILQTMLRLAGLPVQDRFRMTYGFVFVTHSIKLSAA